MRDKFFIWLGQVTYRKYWLVILISLVVTIILGSFADKIRMEVTWMSMLPENNPSVKSFEKIIDEFGAATNIIVAVEGNNTKEIKQVADEITPALKEVQIDFIDSNGKHINMKACKLVEDKYDIDFIKKHGMMLEKAKNLKKNNILFTDYNLVPFLTHINDVYESQYVEDADNLTKQEKEAERGLDGTFQLFNSLADFAYGKNVDSVSVQHGIDAMTVGDGYYLSSDKKMLLIFVTPSMTINDIDASIVAVDSLDAVLTKFKAKHPNVQMGLTGMHVVMRDEMHAGITDTVRNLIFAIVLILLIFIVSFRMWSGPLLAMIVLITGITWDIGIAQIVLGRLNIMTAVCSIVLIGLGIDYAIHIISSYTELRHKGRSIEDSIGESFLKIGAGLVTGALTTAVAFLSIAIIGSQALMEFGFVVGVGIISCLLASMFLLPAVLVAKEKLWGRISKNKPPKKIDMEFHLLGKISNVVTARPWVTVIIATLITAFFIYEIPKSRMNQNYMDLEPKGLESIRLQKEIVKRFYMSPDNMMAIYDNIEQVNKIQDILNSKPSIGMVESIASVLPSKEKQKNRRPYVEQIHKDQNNLPKAEKIDTKELVAQLHRFSDNIIEISSMAYVSGLDRVFNKANEFVGLDAQGNQVGTNYAEALADYIEKHPEAIDNLRGYQKLFRPIMQHRIAKMSDSTTITLNEVPKSYRERYVSKDGKHFLMAFYSSKDIWQGLYTTPFLKTILRYVPNGTGSPVIMKEMIDAIGGEGVKAFLISLIAIFLLLLVDFRSIKTTLISLVPLVMSAVWLFGIMGLFDIKFTIINVIGFPLLVGIGIDDGVHIIHRYRREGKTRLAYSISSIGKAILLTSVTTILGFASLLSSEYRGYIGLGLVVSIGIALCFIMSVMLLPAIIKIAWGGKKDYPKFFSE
jgi:uncharacterized protein